MKEFKGKNVLIAGGGVSGQGAEYAVTKRGATARILSGEALYTLSLEGVDLIVASPGIDSRHPLFCQAAAAHIPVISEIELGFHLCDAPVIAVTGTNGKTTTAGLIHAMLQKKYQSVLCGNIGVSYSRVAADGGYDAAVVEVSSFQLEHTYAFRPRIAVITNIAPDHLDRHGTMSEYAACKCRIAANMDEGCRLFLSAEDIPLDSIRHFTPRCEVAYFSASGPLCGVYVLDGKIYDRGELICETGRVRLIGAHNLKNALAAVAAARAFGAPREDIVEALSTYVPDAHRLCDIGSVRGVRFYNDSKATNISAALAAAVSVPGPVAMIVGGQAKGCHFDPFFQDLPASVTFLYVIGEAAEEIAAAAARAGFTNITLCPDLKSAAIGGYRSGAAAVLLAPAAASFDQFVSYADRGRTFETIVEELKRSEG